MAEGVYEVLDDKGNVVKKLVAPAGGSLKQDLESGTRFYKTNNENEEDYVSMNEAKATVSISPTEGKIIVSGPSWLTSDIINSDSFKKNYTENSSLLSLVNAYRTDPTASIADPTTGEPIKVSDAIGEYMRMANEYAGSYAQIKSYKEQINKQYGVGFTDTDVAIATNYQGKEDYDSKSAIYIPDWAIDNYNWSSASSWDADKRTVSAEDFYKEIYKEDFGNDTASKLQQEAMDKIKEQLEKNNFVRDNSEDSLKRQEELKDGTYATEVARTLQMFNILSKNKPEVGAAYNALLFTESTVCNFLKSLGEAGENLSALALQIAQAPANLFNDLAGLEGEERIPLTVVGSLMNLPLAAPALIIGEAINFVQDGGNFEEFGQELTLDMANLLTGYGGDSFDYHSSEIKGVFDEFNAKMGQVSGAWDAGAVVGDLAYKIAENVVLLNTIGGAIAKASKAAMGLSVVGDGAGAVKGITGGLAAFMGKAMSEKAVIGIVSALAAVPNVVAQGMLETLIDNKDVLNKAIASGEMTPELYDTVNRNIMWNAVGEFTGFGASKGGEWLVKNTTTGKIVANTARNVTAAGATASNTAKYKIFTWLNKGDVRDAVSSMSEATGRTVAGSLGKYTASQYKILADAWDTIRKMPIIGEMTTSQKEAIEKAYDLIDITKYGNKAIEEAAEDLESAVKEIGETTDIEGVMESTEQATKAGLSDRVNDAYEYGKKMRTVMANLENQFDMINKGVSIKMSEINNFAKAEYEEWTTKRNDIAAAERSNKKLTFGNDGVLSKEGSDYLSLKAQQNWYKSQIVWGTKSGKIDANKIAEWQKYSNEISDKLASLRGTLGDNLADGYDELVTSFGKFQKKIDDYMFSKGYFSKEHMEKLTEWRARLDDPDSGVGSDNWFHTARQFTNEDKTMGMLINDLENPAMFTAKLTTDEPRAYKPGDTTDSFVDPTLVIYGYERAAAAVAQGQELARAVQAATLPIREVKGLNGDGTTLKEASVLSKDYKTISQHFNSIMSDTGVGSTLRKAMSDALYKSDLIKESLADFRAFTAGIEKFDTTDVVSRINKTQSQIDALTRSNGRNNSTFIPMMQEQELDALLATAKSGEVPNFNIKGMKAADFNEWYGGLSGKMKKTVDRAFKQYGNRVNVTTLKKIAKDDANFVYKLKKDFLTDPKNADSLTLRQSKEYSELFKTKATNILSAESVVENAIYSDSVQQLQKLYGKYAESLSKDNAELANLQQELAKLTSNDPSDVAKFMNRYAKNLDQASDHIMNEVVAALRKDSYFNDIIKKMVDAGADEETAIKYVVSLNLKKMSGDDISKLILHRAEKKSGEKMLSMFEQVGKGTKTVPAKKVNTETVYASQHAEGVSKVVGNSLNEKFTIINNQASMLLKSESLSAYMDLDDYWKEVEGLMKEIEGKGIKFNVGKKQIELDFKRRERNLIQMVDYEGTLRFYETDPLYADIINFRPGFGDKASGRLTGALNSMNSITSEFFRWGTTGMDLTSYINQWFRDPINAVIVGGAKPFIDLRVGGLKSALASFATDFVPFGERLFGKYVSNTISDEVVESVFKSTEDGIKAMYGQEWLDDFKMNITKGVTGDEAEAIYRRALVEYDVDTTGFATLPFMGGKTEVQAYRASDGKTMGMSQVRREEFDRLLGRGMSEAERDSWVETSSKMRKAFDDLVEDTSKGSWRETFLRKSVYTTNYKKAIEAGMTVQDAKIWATRYALDATTDFSRPFGYANRFIKSIPYLGAAINGQKSFFRLLTLDPEGIGSRFTFGLILPYMALLGESLSSEENRNIYKSIPDYEKEDSFVFVVNGSRMQIPIPQELSAFVAPFRHAVEKSADANDKSWLNLITSDALGAMPLDLSGFVDLDANELLADSEETGLWAHISRGMEKAGSSLMPPAVKAAYMIMSGRDPYTGKEIDTSYTVYDEDGNPVPMDYHQYEISQFMTGAFPDISASAWDKILKNLLGRSTLSVMDSAAGLFTGKFDAAKSINGMASNLSAPFDAGYDSQQESAKKEWQGAINKLYDMREALVNDKDLSKALSIMRTADNEGTSKYENAKRLYNAKMDEYAKTVVDVAKAMKEKYPESYSKTRMAQVVSLLTMPTGIGYNDTAYADELQKNSYYDSKNRAVETFLRLGAPQDYTGMNSLGRGYYDSNGEFQFKVYTPYEIEYLNSASIGSDKQIQAMVSKAIKDADINTGDMWAGYYKATDKASRKEYKQDWNAKVVTELYPIISKYGSDNVLSDTNTVDLLDNYIFVDNPYKTKQYLKQIFGGE